MVIVTEVGSHLIGHLGADGASVLDVALHVLHAVHRRQGRRLELVHRHDVAGDRAVDVLVGLIDHDMHQIEPAQEKHK